MVVKIGAAGLCRTDLHIQEGQGGEAAEAAPYAGARERGWMHEVGSGVTNVEAGDTVILHPLVTCGLRGVCRRATTSIARTDLPGIIGDGGFADFLKTTARAGDLRRRFIRRTSPRPTG